MLIRFNYVHLVIPIVSSVFLLLISVSCGSQASINVQNLSQQSEPSAESDASYQIIMAVTDIAIGENRLAFAVIGKTGPLITEGVSIKLSPTGIDSDRFMTQAKAVFHAWPQSNAGVYIANVNFDTSGEWAIQVEGLSTNNKFLGATRFFVNKTTSSPAVGIKPKPLENLTFNEVTDISQITSSLQPDTDLYKISVSDAMNNGMPTIITFASPSFCRTSTCGPQIEIISSINERFGASLNVIHIEVYERSKIDDEGKYELKVSGFLKEWGLNSEPFTFMLDKDGFIVAKFEGFVTLPELEAKITEILGI